MTRTMFMNATKKALLVTVALGGLGYTMVTASAVENFVSPQQAARAEDKAAKALAKHKYIDAISWGEQAVLGEPHNADYRMLLAQANLSDGRFASAETLFNDVLTLDPSNGAAARITHVACMAHARRYVFDVFEATQSPVAAEALRLKSKTKDRSPYLDWFLEGGLPIIVSDV